MEKSGNLEQIGIENSTHTTDIVSMCANMFPETIMSIQEEDYESGVLREDEWEEFGTIQISIDKLLTKIG